MQPTFKLSQKGLAWLRTGHLWIYRDDVAEVPANVESGAVARVASSTGAFVAQAFYSARGKIALRVISFEEAPVDRAFLRSLLLGARERRPNALPASAAFRLVSAEGDLFPGLIIDVYAGHYVVQSMIAGTDRIMPELTELLDELFAPLSITLRCDLAVREMEGLDREKKTLKGGPQREVMVEEGPVKYLADLWEGQKTGAYLDQQENRIRAGRWAHGRGLDAFCFHGLFALHLARGCSEVVALDGSAAAIERVKRNSGLNGLDNIAARKANVFDEFAAMEKAREKFDVIVLDPPPFAKSRKDLAGARKGYADLNRRAMNLLRPRGVLLTYSCSYNLSAPAFLDVLRSSAADARRRLRILEQQTQAPDHPILLSMPETHYLKGFALEAMD
ncbi:MAG TPA: class I SAM-dependent rRNA methyltransferase [bacterium]|nr:class I SAM-dependent rRNA methyltransferase [bacterium]